MHQAFGGKSDEGAKAALAGVELWSMIKIDSLIILMAYLLGNSFTR